MPSPPHLLQTAGDHAPAGPPSPTSDVVVILAALLCALICVVGLALVARCACIRRSSAGPASSDPQIPANKGLKKKVLLSLPKLSFNGSVKERLTECPICLTEFTDGDEIRVLPQCGHGFHVACVDTWLGSHSSCPSCRQVLSVGRCQRCGSFSASEGGEVMTTAGSCPRGGPHSSSISIV